MQADFLAQFLNFQQPAMQTMMSTYMDQSAKMMQQMQEKLQSQTRNMFTTGYNSAGQPTKEERGAVVVRTGRKFFSLLTPR
jgi:polyhydroxyalkanoate synthesis regulator protein